MASLAARYAAGEHEAVWRELDFGVLPIKEQFEIGYENAPSGDEAEDVMRQTFERVARNLDHLTERLRGLGYQFECESGKRGPIRSPRTPGLEAAERARKGTLERFDHLGVTLSGPFPHSFLLFAELVGSVDLRQAFPGRTAQQEQYEEVRFPGRLGDWDPLEVDFDYLAYTVGDEEAEMHPLPNGGLALHAEFAASFEHKADISGAWNPTLYLPSYRVDPMIYAEGIALPFTTYLRRIFARGGFFGSPRPIFRTSGPDLYLPEDQWPEIEEVEPSIWLPKHPVFARLADGLEAF